MSSGCPMFPRWEEAGNPDSYCLPRRLFTINPTLMNKRNIILMLGISLSAFLILNGMHPISKSAEVAYQSDDVRSILSKKWTPNLNENLARRSFGEKMKEKDRFVWRGGGISDLEVQDGILWLCDYSKQQLHQVSNTGHIIQSISKEGEAPWEHTSLSTFSHRNENLITYDQSSMAFRKFSGNGTFKESYSPDGIFHDGTTLSNTKAILAESAEGGVLNFALYDFDQKKIIQRTSVSEILGLVNELPHADVALFGSFTPISTGGAYYTCLKAGIIIKLDEEGGVVYVNTTIDAKTPPKVSVRESGPIVIHIQEPDYVSNFFADGDDEEFMILSNIRFTEGSAKRIDVYEAGTGKYKHSIEVPLLEDDQMPVKFSMDGKNLLHVLYEDQTMVTYKRQILMP